MDMRFEGSDYRKVRGGGVAAVVRVVAGDGAVLFADTVNLTDARARGAFVRALAARLDGSCPPSAKLEAALLALLQQAEEELARPAPAGAPGAGGGASDRGERVEQYIKTPQGFFLIRYRETRASGVVEERVPLSTFTAEITEDVLIDDGAEERRLYVVHGRLGDRALPPARVPAADFATLRWVAPAWGLDARVLPGQGRSAYLADAILAFSRAAVRRQVFAHLGWRRLGDRWAYLHAGGAIGASGPVSDVTVELDGALARYRLPDPPGGDTLRQAVRRAWDFWDVAQPAISAPFLGAAYAAPLAEWLAPDFSIWAFGHTGRLKTSYCATLLAHFGDFNFKHVPASWEDTANSLEKAAFLAKDALLLIDDFRPPADRAEAAELRRKAARLVRDAGNRVGRRRLRADLTLRPAYAPRGIVISTAEERVYGDSAAARRWEVPFEPDAVDAARLAAYQADPTPLRLALAAYLQHLAAIVDQDNGAALRKLHRAAREQAPVGLGGHLRHPSTWATLLTGWLAFCNFAVAAGAVTETEARARLDAVGEALTAAGEAQAQAARETRTELVFLRTLGDLLSAGRGHLCAAAGGEPAEAPEAWGWTRDAVAGWRPRGDMLGWVSEVAIDLIPTAAQRAVARALQEAGVPWAVSPHTLHRALAHGGFLLTGTGAGATGERYTTLARVEGRVQRVLRLDRRRVAAVWEGCGDDA